MKLVVLDFLVAACRGFAHYLRRCCILRGYFLTSVEVFDAVGEAGAQLETMIRGPSGLVRSLEACLLLERHV